VRERERKYRKRGRKRQEEEIGRGGERDWKRGRERQEGHTAALHKGVFCSVGA
jgi:hypothetical protein